MSDSPLALINSLQTAYAALTEAREDFERLRIRDQAQAAVVAAKVLELRDIQTEASILVATAEREIARAHPPQPAGRPAGDEKSVLWEDRLNSSTLRNIRQAHQRLSDEQFASISEQAREKEEPLTRSLLIREGRKLNPPSGQCTSEDKPPTRTELLEGERDAARLDAQEKAERIQALEDEVRFLRGEASDLPHEREATFNRFQAEINTLRSQVAEWQTKQGDERRRANYWERQAKRLGWQPTQSQPPLDPKERTEPSGYAPPNAQDSGYTALPSDRADVPGPVHDAPEEMNPEPTPTEPSKWENAQWVGPFRKGDWVLLPDGKQGIVQNLAPDGRAMVATGYGTDVIKPFGLEQLKAEGGQSA